MKEQLSAYIDLRQRGDLRPQPCWHLLLLSAALIPVLSYLTAPSPTSLFRGPLPILPPLCMCPGQIRPSQSSGTVWVCGGLDSRPLLRFSGRFLPLHMFVLPGGGRHGTGPWGMAGRWICRKKQDGIALRVAEVNEPWFRRKGGCGEWGSLGVLRGHFRKQREQGVAVLQALRLDQIRTQSNVLEPGNA